MTDEKKKVNKLYVYLFSLYFIHYKPYSKSY